VEEEAEEVEEEVVEEEEAEEITEVVEEAVIDSNKTIDLCENLQFNIQIYLKFFHFY